MRIVGALACALAVLVRGEPAVAVEGAARAEREQAQAEQRIADEDRRRSQLERRQAQEQARERASEERRRLQAQGYEALKPFRDCPDCPLLIVIPAGAFLMGSPAEEMGRYSAEAPQHRVTITQAFALAQTELTQGQWRALMGSNPSHFSDCGDDCPVEQVSWNDAQEYLSRLSKKTGKRYRLPSEAEWEYAARAGTTSPFHTGNCIDGDEANYDGNYDYGFCRAMKRLSRQRTLPVASFAANGFALHDMLGNVWEWVEDCWQEDYRGAPVDGSARSDSACASRVLRGGSWRTEARALRSAERNWEWARERGNDLGFRVARSLF